MNQNNGKRTEWQLMRERFQITDRFPPCRHREERNINAILSGIIQEEPEPEVLPKTIETHWNIIAGDQIAQHTHPSYLRNGILYIYADHPGWLAEIRRLPKNYLLKKIASVSPSQEISEIRFQLDPTIRTKGSYNRRK